MKLVVNKIGTFVNDKSMITITLHHRTTIKTPFGTPKEVVSSYCYKMPSAASESIAVGQEVTFNMNLFTVSELENTSVDDSGNQVTRTCKWLQDVTTNVVAQPVADVPTPLTQEEQDAADLATFKAAKAA